MNIMATNQKKSSAKKKNKKRSSEAAAEPITERNRLFLPVVFTLAILPLIVHFVLVNVEKNEAALFGQTSYGDFFSQAKAGVLAAVCVILVLMAFVSRKKLFAVPNRSMTVTLVASGVFILFTLISSSASKYPAVAFWGAHDRAEGFVTILCYFLLFLYTAYTYRSERDYRNIVIALSVITVFTAVVGIFQYTGHDLMSTGFGKALVIAPWDRNSLSNVNFTLGAGKLYGTFYHYDYVGSVAAILIPLFLVLALYSKTLKSRILLWSMEGLSWWLLLGSTSRAGVVGVAAALLFLLIFFARRIAARWKIFLPCLAVLVAAVFGLNFMSHGKVFARVPSLFSDAAGIFQSSGNVDYRSQLPVKDLSSEGSTALITTQSGHILKVSFSQKGLQLKDENGKQVAMEKQDGKSVITDPRFQRFSFGYIRMGDSSLGIAVKIDGQQQFYYRVDAQAKLQLTDVTGNTEIHSLAAPPSFGFRGQERLGSARGYIWSRANAMVPQNLIIGSGPDTFALNFPQSDLFGKYWSYGTANMIVDKPHNLYLQTLLGEGGIAFLAFLVILLHYLVDSFRLYAMKKMYGKEQIFGAAVCLGILGYLFAGFFNDSIVSVAPIFWILLGVGTAVNEICRKAARSPLEVQE